MPEGTQAQRLAGACGPGAMVGSFTFAGLRLGAACCDALFGLGGGNSSSMLFLRSTPGCLVSTRMVRYIPLPPNEINLRINDPRTPTSKIEN